MPRKTSAADERLAGSIRTAKGKANVVIGAARGSATQEMKGLMQKAAGRVQKRAATPARRTRASAAGTRTSRRAR